MSTVKGMRVLHEDTYRERMALSRKLGRRDQNRIIVRRVVFLVVVLGLMFGGIGLVSSRAEAKPPIATGGGRVMVKHEPLERWVRTFIVKHTKGHVKWAAPHVECRGVKCAAYGGGIESLVIVKLANGRFHVLKFLVAAFGPTVI